MFFKRNMTGMEQRLAGMPPPSQRQGHQPAAPFAQDASGSEIERFRAAADRAEEELDAAFEERRRILDALDEAEIESYTDAWNTDLDDDEEEEAALSEYEARTANPLSQSAVDAMDEKQRELFIRAGAATSGAVPAGKQWRDENWKSGKQLER